jgi:hypothetical protein
MGWLAGARGLCVVGRGGDRVAAVAAGVSRVWGHVAVAVVVVLALCVGVPAARALTLNTEIAFQANTGELWTWSINKQPSGTGLGMAAGTSPSVASLSGLGLANHEIAFQANTGDLWTIGPFGQGDTGLGDGGGYQPEHRL